MKSGFSLPSSRKRFSENSPLPRPVRLMVLRYCLGMIASVSTLICFNGAATPSSTVNLSMAGDLLGISSRKTALKHDPEKWIPVFGKDHAQTGLNAFWFRVKSLKDRYFLYSY